MVRQKTRISGSRRPQAGLIAALAAIVLGFGADFARAAEDPVLSQFAGNWIGRGKYWASPSARPEIVYCKVTNTLVDGGGRLEQKGRCAVASNSGSVKGTIAGMGDGAYQGSLESLSTKGPAKLSGRGGNDRLDFKAEFIDRQSRQPGRANVTLIAGAGKYRLVTEALDEYGQSNFVTTDILFAPQ